jgi:hypothetical protein
MVKIMTPEEAKRIDDHNHNNMVILRQWAEELTKFMGDEIEFLKQRVSQLERIVNEQQNMTP